MAAVCCDSCYLAYILWADNRALGADSICTAPWPLVCIFMPNSCSRSFLVGFQVESPYFYDAMKNHWTAVDVTLKIGLRGNWIETQWDNNLLNLLLDQHINKSNSSCLPGPLGKLECQHLTTQIYLRATSILFLLVFCFVLRPLPVLLRAYFWLCAQRSLFREILGNYIWGLDLGWMHARKVLYPLCYLASLLFVFRSYSAVFWAPDQNRSEKFQRNNYWLFQNRERMENCLFRAGTGRECCLPQDHVLGHSLKSTTLLSGNCSHPPPSPSLRSELLIQKTEPRSNLIHCSGPAWRSKHFLLWHFWRAYLLCTERHQQACGSESSSEQEGGARLH